MFDHLVYVNHLGERLEFGSNSLYANSNDIRDFKWDYTTNGNNINNFSRKLDEKKIDFVIYGPEDQAIDIKNNMTAIADKDIQDETPGRIYIGNEYIFCYIIASEKTDYLTAKNLLLGKLSVVPTTGEWIREVSFSFSSNEHSDSSNTKKYPYGYPYGYGSSGESNFLYNSHYKDTEFLLTIYGQAINPAITIGDNMYKVNVSIANGEWMQIDSRNKTIRRCRTDGVIENDFQYREKTSNIFKRIPPGKISMVWSPQFNFDITLFEGRSEPKWI